MTRRGRLRVGQRFAVVITILALLLAVGVFLAAQASQDLTDARLRVIDQVDPALLDVGRLQNGLVDQETGVRGFVIAGNPLFLEPYLGGRAIERQAVGRLRALIADEPALRSSTTALADVTRLAEEWRDGHARPAIRGRRTKTTADDVNVGGGRVLFERVRVALDRLQSELDETRVQARRRLLDSADSLNQVLLMVAALLAAGGLGAVVFIRRGITLPVAGLAREVRRVADGDYGRAIQAGGPRDVVALAADVDSMRARIVEELDATKVIQEDLERSNTELEQFAYVASHDLQEPLRKVASFTQMLQRRYEGQLDERADQYIYFAVDGAKRMQELINDLLAFSRVGRVLRDQREVSLHDVIDRALTDLAGAIEASGASVEVNGTPPTVTVDPGLMALVFQNLIGNAVKFGTEDRPPVVRVDIGPVDEEGECEVAIHDDGIGIEDEYADRIFIIFQRLHPKERYGGTGIGLAMCRKIVEYHGGRIWLDTGHAESGTTFRFTIPTTARGSEGVAVTARPQDHTEEVSIT
ncbi:MAG: multi-sensor signal transduction histidine kinase [Solirubrobacterales bacterium]|nr:multi-sensor signal transduction histidine kinase [Solirubrobacterales bacterium]